jgi:hypothetical protein
MLECALCDLRSPVVRPAVVEWAEPAVRRFDAVPRCPDHDACRQRLEARGEPWPLATDSTPAPWAIAAAIELVRPLIDPRTARPENRATVQED